jgi:hypothetical protein
MGRWGFGDGFMVSLMGGKMGSSFLNDGAIAWALNCVGRTIARE